MFDPGKTAVIDVGSNSVRLVVYYGAKRAPLQFYNEKVTCGLGQDLSKTGVLHSQGRISALNALRRFANLIKRMDVENIYTVATAAVRNAQDGADFCDQVFSETGLTLRIVSGVEEGTLSAQGIFFCRPDAKGLVCDLGGSSMELAQINNGKILLSKTSDLGPLNLQMLKENPSALDQYIDKQIISLFSGFKQEDTLYLIGGAIRTIAGLDMERKSYPLSVVNEYTLSNDAFNETLNWLMAADFHKIKARGVISPERLPYLPLVARVLHALLDKIKPKTVVFSSFGIREGLLYEQMALHIQRRDPLIQAAQFSEASNARFKDFGTTLFAWILPLFEPAKKRLKRLIWAASLLHDVTWKAHPDYRAEVSFDYATRSNLAGISHQERIFLALALIHRYTTNPKLEKLEKLNILMPESKQKQAKILGRALRLGALLGGPDVAHMGHLNINGHDLELILTANDINLISEVVEHRLSSLARAMGKAPKLRTK